MRCGHCKFWQSPEGAAIGRSGECRKAPPLVLPMQGPGLAQNQVKLQFQSYWPPVSAEHWCGAFEPRIGTA
jgi:hypothetical protein